MLPILIRKHNRGDVYFMLFPTLGLSTVPKLQCLRITFVPELSPCGTKDLTMLYFESTDLKDCIKYTTHQPHFSRTVAPYIAATTHLLERLANAVSTPLKESLNVIVEALQDPGNPLKLSVVRNLGPKLAAQADAHACALTESYSGMLTHFPIKNEVLTKKARPKVLESTLTATQKELLEASYPTKISMIIPQGLGKSKPQIRISSEDFI